MRLIARVCHREHCVVTGVFCADPTIRLEFSVGHEKLQFDKLAVARIHPAEPALSGKLPFRHCRLLSGSRRSS